MASFGVVVRNVMRQFEACFLHSVKAAAVEQFGIKSAPEVLSLGVS